MSDLCKMKKQLSSEILKIRPNGKTNALGNMAKQSWVWLESRPKISTLTFTYLKLNGKIFITFSVFFDFFYVELSTSSCFGDKLNSILRFYLKNIFP